MKKVELEVTKVVSGAGDYPDGTFVASEHKTTHKFSTVEGKIIYYTNSYNLFSSKDRDGSPVNYAIEISKINNDSVVIKYLGDHYWAKNIVYSQSNDHKILSFNELKKRI